MPSNIAPNFSRNQNHIYLYFYDQLQLIYVNSHDIHIGHISIQSAQLGLNSQIYIKTPEF
jgi:hypothetical protein